jgi:hypothetical protein
MGNETSPNASREVMDPSDMARAAELLAHRLLVSSKGHYGSVTCLF